MDYNHASEDATALIHLEPKNVAARLIRCQASAFSEDYRRVIEDASVVIDLQPKNDMALLLRGLAYKRLGNDADADADLIAAVKINPKHKEYVKANDTSQEEQNR